MKIMIILMMLVSFVNADKLIMPSKQFKADAQVIDVVVKGKRMYCATAGSCVNIFDLKSQKLIKRITVDKIKDFMGDLVDTKIYSVDVEGDKILLLTEAKQGYRRLYLHQHNTSTIVLDDTAKLSIAKAKFLDANTVLLALLSDELIAYNLQKQKIKWRVQVSGSKFSNFALNEKRDKVAVVDESGDLQLVSTVDGHNLKSLSGQNLDNVFEVDYKHNIVATAGQDRRCVIYDLTSGRAYYKSSHFLVYGVGLSPSGKRAAYSSDENNNITLFNTQTEADIARFGGNKMTISGIVFLDEDHFLVYSDAKTINQYSIP
jgi:WD40 repeat protein